MELCELCGVTSEEVKIYDAIQNGRMITICQRCSIIENITTIIKPNPEQLKDSERPVGILKRMRRIAGIEEAIDTIEMLIESLKSEMAILKKELEPNKLAQKFEEVRLSML